MENNLQTKYEFYGVPQSITILNKKYTYKSNLKDEKNFVYRCMHRDCKAQITIDKENILKAVLQKRNDQIIYTLGKHTHSCEKKEKKGRAEIDVYQ